MILRAPACLKAALIAMALGYAARAQPRPIDTAKSVVTVRVFKAGILAAFGHDHVIGAPITAGTIDLAARQVEIRFQAADLRVDDPRGSESERAEIRKTMLGPEVLDVQRFADIIFRSSAVESAGPSSTTVRGMLTLHGQTKPITVRVTEKDGHYAGRVTLTQTDFGIQPVRIAGGTVRVKDDAQMEFDITLR